MDALQDPHFCPSVPASHWCISYDQLLDVERQAKQLFRTGGGGDNDRVYRQKTTRDVCEAIIIPKCKETGKSYALSMNPNGLPISVFVTHAWDGSFADFVMSIRATFQAKVTKPSLWICAFALVQSHDERIVQEQVGDSEASLEDSPFVRALQAASSFCVVRNSRTDLYTRIWCICELMYAKKIGLFPDQTYVTGPNLFANTHTKCINAQSSRRQDKNRITRALFKEHDREEIDTIVQLFRSYEAPVKIVYDFEMTAARRILNTYMTARALGSIVLLFLLGFGVAICALKPEPMVFLFVGISFTVIMFVVFPFLFCEWGSPYLHSGSIRRQVASEQGQRPEWRRLQWWKQAQQPTASPSADRVLVGRSTILGVEEKGKEDAPAFCSPLGE